MSPLNDKDPLAEAIEAGIRDGGTVCVNGEHYTTVDAADIERHIRPLFARQQARVEEVTRERDDALHAAALARRALEDLKRMNGNVDEYMEYGAKAERMKWEYALEACRKSISPRTEAENG